jgi:hypothetical protein
MRQRQHLNHSPVSSEGTNDNSATEELLGFTEGQSSVCIMFGQPAYL